MWVNVWAVIRREYLERVRSKWFVISTLGGPLLMVLLMVVPAYFLLLGEQAERKVAIVDGSNVLYERIAPHLEDGGFEVEEERWHVDVVTALRQQATEGDLWGFIVLDELTLETGEAIIYVTSRPSEIHQLRLRSAITRAAMEYQLERQGLDAGALLSGGELRMELLSDEGTSAEEPQFWVAYLGAFFLYMVILLYAVSVMRATLEEKTSRIVEVIISSMKPWHLMLGKILGVGAVGLTQLAVWIISGFLIIAGGMPVLIAVSPGLVQFETVLSALPGIGMMGLFVCLFIFGFFMYSGLYAAVGAMCNTDEEAQQAQLPMIMLLVIPIAMVSIVIVQPMTPMATWFSLFPLFSPFLMWARVASGGIPAWQIGLSFLLMLLTIFAIAWVAGRIYKVGILMTGKRPTLPELWRWVKEA
ncbi:MAG TPA: ABC transporter permease [Gemmatimonadetes bacterium]|jgi:ABC-2 type transport system permease protein|nr:ABC transporter permease [Gemmatimonadota bacterium]HIB10009.1 ABC transporter permease [Gemmatimonadota bacterium]HIN77843.1 ABC transporter permease [Gemmatimonadota bacterium]